MFCVSRYSAAEQKIWNEIPKMFVILPSFMFYIQKYVYVILGSKQQILQNISWIVQTSWPINFPFFWPQEFTLPIRFVIYNIAECTYPCVMNHVWNENVIWTVDKYFQDIFSCIKFISCIARFSFHRIFVAYLFFIGLLLD